MGFSSDRADQLWWLMVSADVNATRLLLLLSEFTLWPDDVGRVARGAIGRQEHGHWDTTPANAWGAVALRKFSAAFEAEPVTGVTDVTLANGFQPLRWENAPPPPSHFEWPERPTQLAIEHHGTGTPWITVTSRAAIPLTEPLSSGYRITRTVTPVDPRDPDQLSRGDRLRVHLDIEAQTDMTWVVVDDPLPGGASHLGTGLARDSQMQTGGSRRARVARFRRAQVRRLARLFRLAAEGRPRSSTTSASTRTAISRCPRRASRRCTRRSCSARSPTRRSMVEREDGDRVRAAARLGPRAVARIAGAVTADADGGDRRFVYGRRCASRRRELAPRAAPRATGAAATARPPSASCRRGRGRGRPPRLARRSRPAAAASPRRRARRDLSLRCAAARSARGRAARAARRPHPAAARLDAARRRLAGAAARGDRLRGPALPRARRRRRARRSRRRSGSACAAAPPRGASTISMQLAALLDPRARTRRRAAHTRRQVGADARRLGARARLDEGRDPRGVPQPREFPRRVAGRRGGRPSSCSTRRRTASPAPRRASLAALLRGPNADRATLRAPRRRARSGARGHRRSNSAIDASGRGDRRRPGHARRGARRWRRMWPASCCRPIPAAARWRDDARRRRCSAPRATRVRRQMAALRERGVRDAAVLVVDNASGDVLAYVGRAAR